MVRLGSFAAISALLLAPFAIAQDVACQVNGVTVAVVDLATGVCPFTVPAQYPVSFVFNSIDDYDIEFYYSIVDNIRYFTDIVNAGRIISIPAIELYGTPGAPLFQVHVSQTPASNSTAAIRKRLLKQVENVKRDAASDFANSLKTLDGTALPGSLFAVVDITSSSSAPAESTGAGASTGGAETVTEESTTLVTITSCKENKCSTTAVPATPKLTTETIHGVVTSYTTYCPLTEVTVESTTIVTITSCKENKCVETGVPATPVETTETVLGVETIYTTYCPVSSYEAPVVTSHAVVVAAESTTYTTVYPVTTYTTVSAGAAAPAPVGPAAPVATVSAESEVAPAASAAAAGTAAPTVAAESTAAVTTAAVSTFSGAAASNYGKSIVALALIPLAALF